MKSDSPKIEENDEFQKKMRTQWIEQLGKGLPEQLFAVISWGSAATSWLTKVLNSHPEIFCLHAMNLFLILSNEHRVYPRNNGLEYLRIIARSSVGYKAAGDIHGISPYDIPEMRLLLGDKFNAAVVVREPITRLKSSLRLFQSFDKHELYNIDYIDGVIKNKKLTLPHNDYGDKFFVHSINMLNAIVEEINVGKIYRSEDLTTSESKLSEFIEEITHGRIKTDSELLSNMLKIDRINKHAQDNIQFDDWQIDVIRSVVSDEAWNLYSKIGYDKPSFL